MLQKRAALAAGESNSDAGGNNSTGGYLLQHTLRESFPDTFLNPRLLQFDILSLPAGFVLHRLTST